MQVYHTEKYTFWENGIHLFFWQQLLKYSTDFESTVAVWIQYQNMQCFVQKKTTFLGFLIEKMRKNTKRQCGTLSQKSI